MRSKLFVVILCLFFCFISAVQADVFYVTADGSDTTPYDTWDKASTDLQIAIDLAGITAGGPHEVWVKKGVYKPQFNPHSDSPIAREYCFALRNNVQVYGGFAGTETSREERDPEANQTILSGDRGTADTWNDGTEVVDGDGVFCPPPTGDPRIDLPVLNISTNCYHVIHNPGQDPLIDTTALLDGVIVTGGNANGEEYANNWGGGMFNVGASPALTKCIFSGNSAALPTIEFIYGEGGGMYNGWYYVDFFGDPSNPTLTNCTFSGNYAERGGGIANGSGTLTNCTLTSNYSDGGGMWNIDSPILTNCTFSKNYACGMYNYGGEATFTNCTFSNNFGIGMYNSGESTLTNCIFSNNSGSGMHNDGDSILINCLFSENSGDTGGGMYTGPATLTNCTFTENHSDAGGGIFYTGSFGGCLTLINCTFKDNRAERFEGWGAGGAIYADSSLFSVFYKLINCTFSGNSALVSGGAIEGGVAPDYGGAATLINCTFSENSAPSWGAINGIGITATDCIFWGDTGGELSSSSNSSIRYCVVDGNISGFGPGCSNSNPTLGSFGYYGGITDCYSIPSDSPAVNAGASVYQVTTDNDILIYLVPASDPPEYIRLDDHQVYDPTGHTIVKINTHDQRGRWRTDRVDIGSYEYGAVPSPTPTIAPTPSVIPPPTITPTPTPEGYKTPTTTPVPPTPVPPTPVPPTPIPPTPVPAPRWIYDYDGDGTSDICIFRGNAGLWAIRGVTRVYFGSYSDDTVPGDYDGDGTTDIGIFRPDSGLWALRGVSRVYFGGAADLPQQGDYDGDGTADVGIFRTTSGLWAVRGVTRIYFGGSTDEPIPGYYDGGGTKNIGLFRPASGLWAIRGVTRAYFGGSADIPKPGDYNGDGFWDIGIFRSTAGLWAIRGVTRAYFGSGSDLPVPADYDGSGVDSIGIFRASSGLWAARGVTRVYYGSSSDIPVTR